MKMIVDVLKFILGKNQKQAFKRIIILIAMIGLFTTLILNVGFGFQNGKFYFTWRPADVSIKKEL
jgi:hypothetical protein